MQVFDLFTKKAVELVKQRGVGVVPTDTIYGIVASAGQKEAVERVYDVKERDRSKPCIVLVPNIDAIARLGVSVPKAAMELLNQPQTSVILPAPKQGLSYLHRGAHSIAFRIPHKKDLVGFLEKTGPLIAPSTNPEGKLPAKTIKEAQNYFANQIDFYVDAGRLEGSPSKLFRINSDDSVEQLR